MIFRQSTGIPKTKKKRKKTNSFTPPISKDAAWILYCDCPMPYSVAWHTKILGRRLITYFEELRWRCLFFFLQVTVLHLLVIRDEQ